MPALTDYASEGVLTINSVSLNNPAIMAGGDETGEGTLLDLWGLMAERRGEDRLISAAAGVIAYPRRVTVTTYDLRLIVVGDVTTSGALSLGNNDRIGLQTNLAIIKTLIDTSSSGAGTVTATLTRFDGSTITAPIHVLGVRREFQSYSQDGFGGSIWIGWLLLSIPSGRLS